MRPYQTIVSVCLALWPIVGCTPQLPGTPDTPAPEPNSSTATEIAVAPLLASPTSETSGANDTATQVPTKPVQTSPTTPVIRTPLPTTQTTETATTTTAFAHRFGVGYVKFSAALASAGPAFLSLADPLPANASADRLRTPGNALFLSFSNYSDRVAYVDSGRPMRFWLSDLDYSEPLMVESANDLNSQFPVLGYPYPEGEIDLVWLPDDRNILVYGEHTALRVEVDTGTVQPWPFVCDKLVLSPRSSKLALMCDPTASGDEAAVVEWGSEIWFTSDRDIPPLAEFDRVRLPAWSFDGSRVAYVDMMDETNALNIAADDGTSLISLPGLSYLAAEQHALFLPPSRPLQFSRDGNVLLAYGHDPEKSACPQWRNPFTETRTTDVVPCWQVMDVQSGEIIWSLGQSTPIMFPEYLAEKPMEWSVFNAAISADGSQLLLAAARAAQRVVYAVNPQTGEVTGMLDLPVSELRFR